MFKILIFLLFFAASQCLDLVDVPKEVIMSGREKLEMLEENSRLPKYSDCWTNAIKHLKNGCRVLTDSVQSDLALHFTNCFLEMSGQEPLDCVNERTEALKRLCLKEMPDRAYSAYTEFFTQTQNMCYFLQNQVWHRETENTINNLNSNSRIVNEKLREASDLQNVLLEHQKQGLVTQETLLRNGEELSNSLNTSKATLQKLTVDIRESTLEHRTILEDLFKEFHLLHNWLVGRYSLIDKIVYFVISLTLIMISTSVNYTSGARIYLIMNLSANFLLELGLPSILALFHTNITPTFVDSYVWMLRKFFIFDSVLLFIYYLFKYEDKFNKQLLLLIEIKNQNRQILDDILMIKMRSGREYIRGDSVTPPRLSPVLNELTRKSVRQEIKPPTSFPVKNSPVDPLPVLVETENENDETMMPMRSFRSVSRASTVSQSSARYNLRRRTEIFPIKE